MSIFTGAVKRFRESIVAKNTSVLLLGQMFSRVLQIFYVAALARYIGAEGIGKISAATALNGMVILLVAPGITTLLIRDVAADRRLATTYLGNMLFIRFFMSLPFILLSVGIGMVAGYPRDLLYIVFVYALVYMFDALGQILSSAFQAFEVMEYDAFTQVIRDLVNVTLSYFFIVLRLPLILIVGASLVAQAGKFILITEFAHRRLFPLQLKIDLDICKDLLVRSLPFGALTILFSIRFQLGIFILSLFESESVVGIYSAATTLILMLLMVAGAFSSSVLPAYSRIYQQDKGSLPRLYQLSYKYLMLLGFPLGLVTLVFGGKIVELIYGLEFKDASLPILILSASLFAMMGYCNGPLLNTIGKQRFFAWTQALLVLADALLCLLLIPVWGAAGAALANTLSCLGGLILHTIVCHRNLGLALPWLMVFKTLLALLVLENIILIAGWLGAPWWLVLFFISPCAYLLSMFVLKLVRIDELRLLARA